MPETVALRAGALSAELRPASGGRIARLRHADLGDLLVPMDGEMADPWNWPKAGAYPLFPYHNRLVGAAFVEGGRLHPVLPHPALGDDAMHGPAHRRPWRLAARTESEAVLVLDHAPDAEWPFAFRAEQAIRLSGDRLEIGLALTNTDGEPRPGGLGWHPYFPAVLETPVRTDARLAFPKDAQDLPNAVPRERDAGPLPSAGFTDHFSAWRSCALDLAGDRTLVMTADAGLPHLVAHRTPAYVCLEPVSHVAGLWVEGDPATGLRTLRPGERLEARVWLTLVGPDGPPG